jgi:uncharacterized integral membrane protein
MNPKLLFKTLFLIAVLFLLVLIGMHNRKPVELALPPLLAKVQTWPAAYMYFGFFAVGFISGTILTAGGGKGSSRKETKS